MYGDMKASRPLETLQLWYVRRWFERSSMTGLGKRRVRARRRERVRRLGMIALIAVGALVLLVVLPWLVWRGPYIIDAKYIDRTELTKGSAALVTGLRTAVVAFTAALGAGIALLYTARTYRLTRRGQITDRFTKALERLGSPEIYVRIGGILALEQIVQDAPEQAATDAARVLGHFIRHRAPKIASTPDPDNSDWPSEPTADVQAALTALTRTESRTHVDPREVLDLHGLHLAGADLAHADLTHANLAGATLTKTNMSWATLAGASLAGATLTGASLVGATLTRADMAKATLTRADMAGAMLTRAFMAWATLTETILFEATLTRASLFEATLSGAIVEGATLNRTDLSGADLSSARGLTPEQATWALSNEDTKMPADCYVSVTPTSAS